MNWNLVWIVPLVLFALLLVASAPWGKLINRFKTTTSASGSSSVTDSKIGQELMTIALVAVGGILFWYIGWEQFVKLPLTQQIMVGVGLICLFWVLTKKPEFSLATGAKYVGIFLLVFAGFASGPGQDALSVIDDADASIKAGGTIGCPGTQEVKVGETFTLKKDCVTRLRVSSKNTNPHYQMTKPVFSQSFNHYVSPSWAGYNLVELDPIEENWPKDAPIETKATLLTAEQAAEISIKLAKKELAASLK